jgi:hypothetical protein
MANLLTDKMELSATYNIEPYVTVPATQELH